MARVRGPIWCGGRCFASRSLPPVPWDWIVGLKYGIFRGGFACPVHPYHPDTGVGDWAVWTVKSVGDGLVDGLRVVGEKWRFIKGMNGRQLFINWGNYLT
jgi:hypothetical protein